MSHCQCGGIPKTEEGGESGVERDGHWTYCHSMVGYLRLRESEEIGGGVGVKAMSVWLTVTMSVWQGTSD